MGCSKGHACATDLSVEQGLEAGCTACVLEDALRKEWGEERHGRSSEWWQHCPLELPGQAQSTSVLIGKLEKSGLSVRAVVQSTSVDSSAPFGARIFEVSFRFGGVSSHHWRRRSGNGMRATAAVTQCGCR